jgi:hypothetical protein
VPLPIAQIPASTTLSMDRAFIDVFPNSVLLVGHRTELILLGTAGPRMAIAPERFEARLRSEPAVQADLDRIMLGKMVEILGMHGASAEVLRRVTQQAVPVTDDNPLMEYGVSSYFFNERLPHQLYEPFSIRGWYPGFQAGNGPRSRTWARTSPS